MEIKTRIVFRTDDHPDLISYLTNNGVYFKLGEILSVVEILESNPLWPTIKQMTKNEEPLYQWDTLYTKSELDCAEWLSMRSIWRFGYPQPENNFAYERITYSSVCPTCGSGKVQISPFRIKKAPKWGSRNFMELNWVGDSIFVSDIAREMLINERITGIDFMELLDKNGDKAIQGISQLVIPTVLENGFVYTEQGVREFGECSQCGVVKYVTTGKGMLMFKKNIFENQPDVVLTGDSFGGGHYSTKIILVKQKVYKAIVKNKLGRALEFEPIMLV